MMEQRPKVSQIVIDEFARIVDSQDDKGIKKYNKTIDDAIDADYNWELMALEETADLQKYLVKRIKELEQLLARTNQFLHEAEEENKWLTKQLLQAKEKIRELKVLSRVSKCLQLEEENLRLADENKKLKDDKDLYSRLFIKGQLKE